MIVVARFRRELVHRICGGFSWQDGRSALLASKYHRLGRLGLHVPKQSDRLERAMKAMDARRGELARKSLLDNLPQKGR